ncbi:hypothetical protein [Neobacillus niacini]|uniref:DUF7830 domain-containing protein n=1 Tax=Neobacillus niacini TaxID=86668 RepID=UPI00203A8851|nr:hypothetical protein [Neobacillus niacini]MCM3694611.1 hypothetical protein [Neobacillus niacini]
MDEALLHGDLVNIEAMRIELEGENLSRIEIRRKLDDQLRAFSKKKAFTCPCCDEPVNMNLTIEEGRPFYFKHLDGKKCTYSENSNTYENHVSTHQDKKKKDIGLTVFREILEGQLKPFGAEIERGYFYKKKLSFIPDFTVSFPFSKEIWAIDYYTSISEGSYAQNLAKRMNAYKAEGFRVFAFIDDIWLAINAETNKGTLLIAELQAANKSKEDQHWDQYLTQKIPRPALQFLETRIDVTIDTKSIAYVNIESRTCKIIRFLEAEKNNRNLTFYKLSEPTIPLERALTLNNQLQNFLLYHENEEDLRLEFMESLMDKMKQAEDEVKAQQEALGKWQRENEEKQVASEKWSTEAKDRYKPENERVRISDEQIEREMLEIAKAANERPVSMSPEEWDWFKKTGRTNAKKTNGFIQAQPVALYETTEEKILKEHREKFKEKLLSHPIRGDHFIDGQSAIWRKFILKWIKEHQQEEDLEVSMKKLLSDMKDFGITFNQKDSNVQYLLKGFLTFFQMGMKKDLKKKINITYMD